MPAGLAPNPGPGREGAAINWGDSDLPLGQGKKAVLSLFLEKKILELYCLLKVQRQGLD